MGGELRRNPVVARPLDPLSCHLGPRGDERVEPAPHRGPDTRRHVGVPGGEDADAHAGEREGGGGRAARAATCRRRRRHSRRRRPRHRSLRPRIRNDRVHDGGVAHGGRDRADGHDGGSGRRRPVARRAPHRRPQTGHATERGRHTDRPPSIQPQRKRRDAGGDRGGRPRRRAARVPPAVVRVAGGAPVRVEAGHAHASLVAVGFAEEDGARGPQRGDARRVARDGARLAQERGAGGRAVAERVQGVDDSVGDAV